MMLLVLFSTVFFLFLLMLFLWSGRASPPASGLFLFFDFPSPLSLLIAPLFTPCGFKPIPPG